MLGIDPGTRVSGYGVVRYSGNRLSHIEHGAIRTNPKDTFVQRMEQLQQGLSQVIEQNRPVCACLEQVFLSRNPQSALKLGHARGVLMITCRQLGVEVFELSALQVKQSVTGYGKAPKDQVSRMVKVLLNLEAEPRPEDAADALAGAIALSQHMAHQQAVGVRQRVTS
nr:crossover junction endodeoxyribonuclease RuvC [Desulfurispira natronophila]